MRPATTPDTRLTRRVRHATTHTPVGDLLHRITCPGCGLDMRVIASQTWAAETAEGHAMECGPLHGLSWMTCPACWGFGTVPVFSGGDVHRAECLDCYGRRKVRVG